jgi:Cu(I)/Ag(I) efflux system periplasmic protein CusF
MKHLSLRAMALVALVAMPLTISLPASAQTASAAPATPMAEMSDGEIRKVSKDTGKLTIKHGEIKNLDMPPMTMVFTAKDPAMLDKVAVGDKVRFVVIEEDGKMVVTEIHPAK